MDKSFVSDYTLCQGVELQVQVITAPDPHCFY